MIVGGKETVLRQSDSCFIGPNENREIINRGNEVCTIAVAVAPRSNVRAYPPPLAGERGLRRNPAKRAGATELRACGSTASPDLAR